MDHPLGMDHAPSKYYPPDADNGQPHGVDGPVSNSSPDIHSLQIDGHPNMDHAPGEHHSTAM